MNIDQLFRNVYNNKFLNRNIQYFIKLNRVTRKYDDLCGVNFMIQNKYWCLLKDKLKRKEYLAITPHQKNIIFSIPDFDLFLMVFNRFKHYYPVAYPPLLQEATKKDNLEILVYLHKLGYKGTMNVCLDDAIRNKNSAMVRYLLEKFDYCLVAENKFFGMILNFATEINDLEMVKYMLKNKQQHMTFDKLEVALQVACANGSLEIFQLLYSTRGNMTPFLYWFTTTICHFEMFMYLLHTFKSSIKQEWYIEIAKTCKYKSHEIVLYLLQHELIDQDTWNTVKTTIALDAFKNNDMQVYQQFKDSDSRLKTLYLSSVKGATDSLERVKELLSMGLMVDIYSVSMASKNPNSPEILEYLWRQEFCSTFSLNLFVSKIGGVVKCNQYLLLQFLIKNQYDLSKEQWWWCDMAKVDRNLPFIQLFLSKYPPDDQMRVAHLSNGLSEAATFNSINTFKYLYDLLLLESDQSPQLYSEAYKKAVANSNIDIIEHFIQKNTPHDNCVLGYSRSVEIAELLIKSQTHTINEQTIPTIVGDSNDLHVLKYLMELFPKSNQDLVWSINLAIRRSVSAGKFEHFKYLLAHSNNIHDQSILKTIGTFGNLQMLDYYVQYRNSKEPKPSIDFYPCFCQTIQVGHLELMKYIIDKQGIEMVVNDNLIYKIALTGHSYLIEYLKEPLSKCNINFLYSLKLSKTMYVSGGQEEYNHYLQVVSDDIISKCLSNASSGNKKGFFSFFGK
ncbi:hypothetical protein CYY_004208 [Polysphondylium violaceum]|uniref:Ankyrin repeat-containing protein n=1 Tax=Polysphondylium violaceum TaxID=133409 RepID=A0A8J4V0J0_9MYCE|nr:hypothetical protein CYY_004208 [Polysphondylium violaceum]